MRFTLCLIAAFAAFSPARAAAPPITVTLTGTPAQHYLTFTTRPCYSYTVEQSSNLQTWTTVIGLKPGTGDVEEYMFSSNQPRSHYRVREHDFGFMTRPQPNESFLKEDGVCFAFKLDSLSQMPAKICISKRKNIVGEPWVLIGKLTDFVTLGGVKTVRGPSVWIADEEGSFQVKAVALTSAGATLSECTQSITIGHNHAPTNLTFKGPGTYIGSYPATFATPQPLTFNTTWTDQDPGDEVTRVEFYEIIDAKEVLIGTDRDGPVFGDVIENIRGETEFFPNQLLNGSHEIIAKAYDTRGAVGQTASSFFVTITSGNYRPKFDFPSDYNAEIPLYRNFFYTYPINFTATDPGGGTVTRVEASSVTDPSFGGFGGGDLNPPISSPFPLGTQFAAFGTYTLTVQAFDNSGSSSVDGSRSYARYLKTRVTESLTTYPTGTMLANEILSPGLDTVGNAVFTGIEGPDGANGLFSNPSSPNLGMTNGVLLTTGKFSDWDNGNQDPDTTFVYGTPGDTVLEDASRVTSPGMPPHSSSISIASILSWSAKCSSRQRSIRITSTPEGFTMRLL